MRWRFFGKNSLGNESVYNAGFSLVRYIGKKYGNDKLQSDIRTAGRAATLNDRRGDRSGAWNNRDPACTKSGSQKRQRNTGTLQIPKADIGGGEMIEKEGFGNFYPVFSPDGSKIA